MRTSSKLGLIVACFTLAAAGVPASAAVNPLQRYQSQKISWGACLFKPKDGEKPAQCAQITVPRDWANPSAGVDMKVAISRVAATGPADQRLGALLTNPGGPGGQGSSVAGKIAGLEPTLNQRYDIIGMDPRGTGQEGGQPGFQCQVPNGRLPQGKLDARDRSASSIAAHQQTPRAIAEACQSDAIAPYITTWQTTHDMDLIRGLLGEKKLNYLGYSYGTWLGAKYASMFPENTGKVILDSSMNWQGRLQAAFEDFPRIDQRQFDKVYLPWAARQFPTELGPTAAEAGQTWEKVRAFFANKGLSPDLFDHFFVGMGSKQTWLTTAMILVQGAQALHGKSAATALAAVSPQLRAQLDAQSRATFGVPAAELSTQRIVASAAPPDYLPLGGTRFSVACGDQTTRSASWYKHLSDVQGPQYPLDGWSYGISEPCGYWNDPPRHQPPDLPHSVADNVLVVQGEFDPADRLRTSPIRGARRSGSLHGLGGRRAIPRAIRLGR